MTKNQYYAILSFIGFQGSSILSVVAERLADTFIVISIIYLLFFLYFHFFKNDL